MGASDPRPLPCPPALAAAGFGYRAADLSSTARTRGAKNRRLRPEDVVAVSERSRVSYVIQGAVV